MAERRERRSVLPKAMTPAATRLSDFAVGIYSKPGLGKTTMGSQFPKPIILDTERGTLGIECFRVEIGSWADFIAALDALAREPHDFRTVVVDTANALFDFLRRDVCEEYGVEDPGDVAHGRAWGKMSTRWKGAITRLRSLYRADGARVMPVIMLHEKRSEIREKKGQKVVDTGRYHIAPGLPPSARTILHGHVDFLLHGELDEEGKRILRSQPLKGAESDIEAKGRGREGAMLPDTFPMSFSALLEAFNRTLGAKPERSE